MFVCVGGGARTRQTCSFAHCISPAACIVKMLRHFVKSWFSSLVQRNSTGYSNFTRAASPLSLYIPSYSVSQLPRLAGISSLTCLKQNSLCFPHPPLPFSPTVSPSSVNDNSILPRNTLVSPCFFFLSHWSILSALLADTSSVWPCPTHLHCYHHGPSPCRLSPGQLYKPLKWDPWFHPCPPLVYSPWSSHNDSFLKK